MNQVQFKVNKTTLSVRPANRVTLAVGMNNTGKSRFLEHVHAEYPGIHTLYLTQEGSFRCGDETRGVLGEVAHLSGRAKALPKMRVREALDALSVKALPGPYASRSEVRLASLAVFMAEVLRDAKSGTVRPYGTLIIVDELELGLAQHRQRLVLPGLIKLMDKAAPFGFHVSVVLSTYSPLVLASMEAHFNENEDALVLFGTTSKGKPTAKRLNYYSHGDVSNWLCDDDLFGFKYPGSVEAEEAIQDYYKLMEDTYKLGWDAERLIKGNVLLDRLRRALPDHARETNNLARTLATERAKLPALQAPRASSKR